MKNRTLVYMIFRTDCISLRTVSRFRKSPHHFYIPCSRLEDLEHTSQVIVHDINSFAVLRRDSRAGTVEIELTWLSGNGHDVSGYREIVILSYDKLHARLCKSVTEEKPIIWKTLSVDNSTKQPQLVFKSVKNLHAALANNTVRRRLMRALRDEFRWPRSDKIEFFDDFMPYSFVFKEFSEGKHIMTGGLIFHNQADISKAHYSMHT